MKAIAIGLLLIGIGIALLLLVIRGLAWLLINHIESHGKDGL
jgi:hypothetical protein